MFNKTESGNRDVLPKMGDRACIAVTLILGAMTWLAFCLGMEILMSAGSLATLLSISLHGKGVSHDK